MGFIFSPVCHTCFSVVLCFEIVRFAHFGRDMLLQWLLRGERNEHEGRDIPEIRVQDP